MFNGILIGRARKLRTAGFVVAMAGLVVNGSVRSDALAVNDAVMEWNQIALAATVTAGRWPCRFGPWPSCRSPCMTQSTRSPPHATHLAAGPAPAGASADAAAIAAAHDALVTVFPLQSAALDAARAASLAARGLTEADPGIGSEKAPPRRSWRRARSTAPRRRSSLHRAGRGHTGCVGGDWHRSGAAAGLGQRHSMGAAERLAVPSGRSAVAVERRDA